MTRSMAESRIVWRHMLALPCRAVSCRAVPGLAAASCRRATVQAMDKERDEQMEHMLKLKSQARTLLQWHKREGSGCRAHCVV